MAGPWGGSDNDDSEKKVSRPQAGPPAAEQPAQDGDQSPWGAARKPKTGKAMPPDLEELIRRHDRARKQKQSDPNEPLKKHRMPGIGSNGWTHSQIATAVLAGALALWALSGIYKIEPDEQGVVLRFGEAVRVSPPGLHYHWPMPVETVLAPKVTRVTGTSVNFANSGGKDSGKSFIMTQDQNIVDIDFLVNWKISDAQQFLFNVREPEATVKMAAESVMREVIGQSKIQDVLTGGRQNIEKQTQASLQTLLDEYKAGIQVLQVQLQKVDPPSAVIDAFQDVQRARAEKDRAFNDAQGYANDIVPRAKGEAEKTRADAEAYKSQAVARATGDASRFSDIYTAYKAAPDVTAKRLYIETMEELIGRSRRTIIDSDAKGVTPIVPLPLGTPTSDAAKTPAKVTP